MAYYHLSDRLTAYFQTLDVFVTNTNEGNSDNKTKTVNYFNNSSLHVHFPHRSFDQTGEQRPKITFSEETIETLLSKVVQTASVTLTSKLQIK